MALSRAVVVLALLASAPALTGCLRGDDPEEAPVVTTPVADEGVPDATLPDDRGEAIAFQETNKTEEGLGGMEHRHDYWKGESRVVLYEDESFFNIFPVYPDGEGTTAKSVAYIKLPPPNLVYEGATSVEVTVNEITLSGLPHALAPALTLSYRTAAADDFLEGPDLTVGTPAIIDVNAKDTDMPHSVSSLWAFRIETDKPEWLAAANLTITAVKGGTVVDWPGHPEFYTESDQRVIVDKDFKVHRQGIEEGLLYGAASTWVAPDRLISYGTGYLDVYINITSASASNGAEPTGFFLEFHNATILDAEDEFNDRIDDEEKGRAFTHEDYHFVVPVHPAGMDGPYQPSSRWGFRPVATFAETPAASLCPGCFAYDIDYHMTIVAHKTVEEQARLNE